MAIFTYRSIVAAPPADVFRWHEQPEALAALTPSFVRIEQQHGGVRDDGRVTVSIGVGRIRFRWTLRHYGYVAGRRFCDEQVRGPFAVWRHVHLVDPIGDAETLYQDRIEWSVAGGRLVNGIVGLLLRPLLWTAFRYRHHVVRSRVGARTRRGARRWPAAVMLAATAALAPGTARAQSAAAPVRTVPFVELDRYVGDWFEIARFPNRFQRQCVGDVSASYARRPDGRIDVVNRCRTADGATEARGVARVVDEHTFAKLKVRFAPAWLSFISAVWGDYWIIGLAPDYSWAVVGDPDRDYLWILARAPHPDEASIAAARAVARDNGFDVNRLVPTSQSATR